MAVATTIAAGPIAGGTSVNGTLTLTPPCTGVEITVASSVAAGVTPTFGLVVQAQLSEDGVVFASPIRICEVAPGETRTTYHDAKNCAKVKYILLNTDQTNTVTGSLVTNQV